MTQQLADVALAFAKECLGWEDADTFTIGEGHRVVRNLSPGQRAAAIFNVSKLDAVVAAVNRWSKETHIWVHLNIAVGRYSATTGKDGRTVASVPSYADPRHALLAACVAAQRKLKGVA